MLSLVLFNLMRIKHAISLQPFQILLEHTEDVEFSIMLSMIERVTGNLVRSLENVFLGSDKNTSSTLSFPPFIGLTF